MDNADYAVVRYKNDGTLDSSFSSDGKVTTNIGWYGGYASSVAIQSDGKIVVAGGCSNFDVDFSVVRYNGESGVPTLVNQQFSLHNISIYPNPSSSQTTTLALELKAQEDVTIIIYNLLGEQVYAEHKANLATGKNVFTINTGSLARGMYNVAVVSGKEIITHKLILE